MDYCHDPNSGQPSESTGPVHGEFRPRAPAFRPGLWFDLRDEGIAPYLLRVFRRVREVLKSAGFIELIGDDHMWHSMTAGVRAARAQAKRQRNDPAEPVEIDDLDTYNAGEERIAVGVDPQHFLRVDVEDQVGRPRRPAPPDAGH